MKKEWQIKGIRGIKTIIFGRTLIVAVAFIIQFLLLGVTFFWAKEYSGIVYAGFSVLGLIALLHIFNSRGNPDFKLVWMLPLLLFPVFGALFYTYIMIQPGTKVIYQRLRVLGEKSRVYLKQDEKTFETLKEENPQMGRMADYLLEHGNCPVYQNTTIQYFPLGDDQFPELLKQLKKAEKFIFLEYFILEEGYMWESVLEILQEKVKAGVEVRVMYDGMCELTLLPNFYPKLLKKYGIQCKMFAPIRPVFSSHYNNRDHRKIVVIDGKVAFTGGTNLADEYINKKERFGHWKDTAVMVTGDAVQKFTCMFLEMWHTTEKQEPDYEAYLTPKSMLKEKDGYVIPYDVMPYGTERVGKQIYLDILNTACQYVHIMTPYLILDNEMIDALTRAAKGGIEVQIIMPHIPDKPYAFYLAKTYYEELIAGGVEIYEYTPGFVHAKVFTSDDDTATVGSINLDYRSLYLHFECGVFIYRNPVVRDIEKDFQETLAKCQKVTMTEVRNRSTFVKIYGQVLRIVAPLM